MSKAVLSGKKRAHPSKEKRKRSHSISHDEMVENPAGLYPGISNSAFQRLLGLQREGIRDTVSGGSAAWSQILRQVKKGKQARPSDGTVTILPAQIEYYDVTGRTLQEAHDQLDPDEWGRCQVHYQYDYAATDGRTTKVNLTVSWTIRLPRWRGEGYQRASRKARQEWDRMLRALRDHEDGHANIGRSRGPKIREGLLDQEESALDQIMSQLEAEAQKEQDDFDQKTNHGQNQGVNLDVSIK
jgi:predicted secreted Zn-dependent protease